MFRPPSHPPSRCTCYCFGPFSGFREDLGRGLVWRRSGQPRAIFIVIAVVTSPSATFDAASGTDAFSTLSIAFEDRPRTEGPPCPQPRCRLKARSWSVKVCLAANQMRRVQAFSADTEIRSGCITRARCSATAGSSYLSRQVRCPSETKFPAGRSRWHLCRGRSWRRSSARNASPPARGHAGDSYPVATARARDIGRRRIRSRGGLPIYLRHLAVKSVWDAKSGKQRVSSAVHHRQKERDGGFCPGVSRGRRGEERSSLAAPTSPQLSRPFCRGQR